MGSPKSGSQVDRSIEAWSNNPIGYAAWPHPDNYRGSLVPGGIPEWTTCHSIGEPRGPLALPYLVVQILPFPSFKSPINNGHLRSAVCNPATRRKGMIWSLKGDAANIVQFLGPVPVLKQFWISLTLYMVWCLPLIL